jgi:hypothetical protein
MCFMQVTSVLHFFLFNSDIMYSSVGIIKVLQVARFQFMVEGGIFSLLQQQFLVSSDFLSLYFQEV